MVRYRPTIGAGIAGMVYMSLLFLVARTNSIVPTEETGRVALGLIQLVALFAPALALFMQSMLRYSADKEDRPRKSSGVGSVEPEEYRLFVIFVGFIASFALTSGLLLLMISLDLPWAIHLAVTPIILGMMMVPIALGITFWFEYRDLETKGKITRF